MLAFRSAEISRIYIDSLSVDKKLSRWFEDVEERAYVEYDQPEIAIDFGAS